MKVEDLNKYSNAEKIILAEQLWDSVSKEDVTLSDELKKELDHRLQNLEEGKSRLYTWEETKGRIHKIRQ